MKKLCAIFGILSVLLNPSSLLFAAEAFELGKQNFGERPLGKEADGIVGDFVMRNDKVELLISGNLPLRRANMSTFYGEGNITPGLIYDLTLRDADNDQLVIFCPLEQKGPVNYVRIVADGGPGEEAVIETYTSAAKRGGYSVTQRYRLRDGDQGVLVETIIENTPGKAVSPLPVRDRLEKFRESDSADGIRFFNAIDPAHRCGYAVGWEPGSAKPANTLAGSTTQIVSRFLAVGRSPAEAWGIVYGRQNKPTGKLKLKITDQSSKPLTGSRLVLKRGDKRIPAYPDDNGIVQLELPVGQHEVDVWEIGRPEEHVAVDIAASATTERVVQLKAASAIVFDVTDRSGRSIPCKAQFNPVEGTKKPNLGPGDRAHGCVDQYHSETGKFRVQLPPGTYDVVVTHGPEYSHVRIQVELGEGQTYTMNAALHRQVKSPGWVSTDYHNHSTPSGDNTCGTDDRVISLAVEHIEFAPTTEHNRLYDWAPHIEKLGLKPFISTVPGLELTGRGAHLNAFPYKPDPTKQDGGAPVWQSDPRVNAIVLRNFQGSRAERWIHVNHPDMPMNFVDRNGDGAADGGFAFFGHFIDGLETQNYRPSRILEGAPYYLTDWAQRGGRVQYVREFIWLQLLNQGVPVWAIAVSDAHAVHGNGVGGWRTYVKSSTDDPAMLDWKELSRHSKAGRMILTTGPYLEVQTESGVEAGGLDRVNDTVGLKVRVQCADWLDINRVQVLVNGRQDPRYNYTRKTHAEMFGDGVVKFDQTLNVKLSEDAHIIVVAIGEGLSLKTGFGSSGQSSSQPVAYNNPIFVDVDGGGFQPNYDTLGFPLPVKNLKVKDVEKALEKK